MVTMYGIKNCDTIKKARQWLESNHIDYEFHDYKKQGITTSKLQSWCKALGWETLVNKRGTTWRKLPDDIKNNINQTSAIKVMSENPSLIKRPVLDIDGQFIVGFNAEQYGEVL